MKSHLYNSSLSGGAVRPEDDVLSSSSSSCLEDPNSYSSRYPPDLLGVSWGSYLHSVPPTAGRSSRRVAINSAPQPLEHKLPPLSSSGAGSSAEQSPTRSILRTPLVKESVAGQRKEAPKENTNTNSTQPLPLFEDLQALVNTLASAMEELRQYGVDVSPLSSLFEFLLASQSEIGKAVGQLGSAKNREAHAIYSTMLQLVTQQSTKVLIALVDQGRKLHEQATFLQQTGRQFSKSQQSFLKEQEAMQLALETARAELTMDKQELEEQRAALHAAGEEFRRRVEELNLTEVDSTHIITSSVPGHTQMVTLLRTQKEQSRLEKLLLQQQREIRNLERAHEVTKAELLATQEHSRRLQQKLENTSKEARRTNVSISSELQTTKEHLAKTTKELKREKSKSHEAIGEVIQKKKMLSTVKGISSTQKTLHHELGRMRQQLLEQQRKECQLRQQLEVSCQRLRETGLRLRHQAAWIHTGQHPALGQRQPSTEEWLRAALPHKKKAVPVTSSSLTLPRLQLPAIRRKLPSYHFSKSELFTLARFEDPETAQHVLEWLSQQGKLPD